MATNGALTAAHGALTASRTLDFRLLGPLEVRDGTQPVVLRGRKQRALLAVLLLHAGEWVSSDLLVDALWGEDAPKTARAALQNYVAQLRRLLGAELIVYREGGYELAVAREQIDLCRFQRLLGEARTAGGEERLEQLREALALWRGPPLADLAYEPFASPEAVRLEELRLSALEDEIDAELALGAGPELIERLEPLVDENPFRERFPAQLMLALYRAGRQAHALELYQQTRRRLLDELGIEPGTALRELQGAILRHDDSLQPTAPLARDREAPVEERRKLVTILFADVAYPDALVPELLRETSVRALQQIRAALERHGAQIELRGSDEVMAVFGVPQAHEDDTVRAARAALEIQTEVGSTGEQQLDVRVGIETGEVLAGVDAAGHGFVTGAVVAQTKRLLEHAGPGQALVGETAVRLLGDAVTYGANGAEGVAVILGVANRDAFGDRVEESPLVGRDTALRALHDAFAGTIEADTSQLFLLVGDPGIGKTRLAREFVSQLEGRATTACGRCLSYGKALTYWPLVEALRTLGEPAAPALELLVEGGATSAPQLAWSVGRAFEQAAQERPLLIVVEDLHWAEPALLDLLESVTELYRDAPILLLCLGRPELLDQRPGWRETVRTLLLEPLARTDSELLLDHLKHPPEPQARDRVLDVAAGNPLFLEELSAFVAEGGGERGLPPRIQVLLQARLDLLPEPERLVVTTASLEGMVFHRAALEALLPEERRAELSRQLAALTRGLVIRRAQPEIDDDQAFGFRHQLIRDTAYGALPMKDRARLHKEFADWVERYGGGRAALQDITAYHLEQAVAAQRELGMSEPALQQRAATALAAAAERARRRTDLHAAASFGRRALALLDDDDPRVPRLELELGLMLAWVGDFNEAQRLLAHAEEHTVDPAVTTAIRLGRLHGELQYAPEGVAAAIRRECTEAIPLFERRGDHGQLGRTWHALADAEWVELQIQAAARAYAKAAAEAQVGGDRSLQLRTLGLRLHCLAHAQVSFATALREGERLAAQFPGEPAVEAAVGALRVLVAFNEGHVAEARALADEPVERFRRAGYPMYAAMQLALFGVQELVGGEIEEGERLVLQAIAELEQGDNRLFLGLAMTYLGQVRVAQRRYGEALRIVEDAEHTAGPDDRRTAIYANAVRAGAHSKLREIEQARAAAARAVAVANTTDALHFQATAQYAMAGTLAAAGDLTAALAAAQRAVRLWSILDRKSLRNGAAALAEQMKRDLTQIATITSTT